MREHKQGALPGESVNEVSPSRLADARGSDSDDLKASGEVDYRSDGPEKKEKNASAKEKTSEKPPLEITLFKKDRGEVSKVIRLVDGKPASDGSACRIATGKAWRHRFSSLADFARLIETMPSDQSLALGVMREGIPDTARLVTKDNPESKKPGVVTRTAENIIYRPGKPALVMLDYDTKGMPEDVRVRLSALGGFLGALAHLCPEFAGAGYVRRASTSSGLYHSETDENYPCSGGEHVYVCIVDGSDAERFVQCMHERAWLAGLGWYMPSRAGRPLERSIVDRIICTADRLVFEGNPQLIAPLKQHPRPATIREGTALDTRRATPDLSRSETVKVHQLKAAPREAIAPECTQVEKGFVKARAAELVARGVDEETAVRTASRWGRGELVGSALLEFDDRKIGTKTVADVLTNPERFIGKTLADPEEGIAYGRCKAKVLKRDDGSVFINSFAHGGAMYELWEYGEEDFERACLSQESFALFDEWVKESAASIKEIDRPAKASLAERPPETQESSETKGAQPRIRLGGGYSKAEPESQETSQEDDLHAAIEELNEKHAFVMEAGKATIFRENIDVHGRKIYERIAPADFEKAYVNRQFPVGPTKKQKYDSLGALWMKSPRRKQFLGGVVFDPAGRRSGDYKNLWEGFAVTPKKGSWRLLRKHIWQVVCKRDRKLFKYSLNWMARAVQRPDEQGQVAFVMRGEEGCGKGIVARALLKLFGQHARHVTNAAHLVGRFNEHLQCCVMLFADEAFYAGDRQHVGVLKAIITEPTLAIEAKYRGVIEARNFLHIIMASNEEWVVPASLEARRFFVVEVSNEKRNDFGYFKKLQDELDAGGYAAMLCDLQNRNLTDFKVAAVPQTEGLKTQKKLSLKTHENWWLDVLQRGYVWKSKLGLEEKFHCWHDRVATELLFNSYLEYARSASERHALSRESFGRFMAQCGSKRRFQAQFAVVLGEHIKDGKAQAVENQNDAHGYFFGSLPEARQKFMSVTQLLLEWGDEDGADDPDVRTERV